MNRTSIRLFAAAVLIAAVTVGFSRPRAAAAAATLAHLYTFEGTLADSLGGPSLGSDGGTVGGGRYTFPAIDKGLRLQDGLPDTTNYSIVLLMRYDSNGVAGWRKIVDFENLVSDYGLYLHGAVLQYFPKDDGFAATTNGVDFHVVLTRDSAAGSTKGYVNGELQWTFTDSDSIAVPPGNLLTFFEDDAVSQNDEEGPGSVDCIGIFNGALTESEASALSSAGSCGTVSHASFTDDPLVAGETVIRAVHVTELRARIDSVRARYDLEPFTYTNASIDSGTSVVMAVDITEMRTALAQAYEEAGLTPPTYTDPSLEPGTTIVKAVHITELRQALLAIE